MTHRNKAWLVADSHFGHRKVTEFRPYSTVEDHDRDLIERWNSVVHPSDTVWHLGDLIFGRHNLPLLGELNGLKKLVMGNHDQWNSELYLQYFDRLYGAVEVKNYLLTHVPVHESQKYRFKGNIHGHLHSKKIDDPWYKCVSVEHTNYRPILFQEVINE